MTTLFEDPRLRQRWNEISHNAEAVTENAAAGIWTFSHNYISPCLASVSEAFQSCLTPCLGDPEERALRQRRRQAAEYNFDFYDDWDVDEFGQPEFEPDVGIRSGLLASWGGEDWDRLLAGTGSSRGRGAQDSRGRGEQHQSGRKGGAIYGTSGRVRRKASGAQDDPTIIPSTAPLGFLGRLPLPWKINRTLRYRPSAADLQEHVGVGRALHPDETAPLLGSASDDEHDEGGIVFRPRGRKRSGTTGSGETSDSFRSRGDLFPSDGEGDEDAVPLGDDFTVPFETTDQSSGKSRSTKGKRPAKPGRLSRTVSRTTIGSTHSKFSIGSRNFSGLSTEPPTPSPLEQQTSMDDILAEEAGMATAQRLDPEIERKRAAAAKIAVAQALALSQGAERDGTKEPKPDDEGDHRADQAVVSSMPPEGTDQSDDSRRNEDDSILGDEVAEEQYSGHQDEEEHLETSQEFSLPASSPPPRSTSTSKTNGSVATSPPPNSGDFIAARLPNFR